MLLTQGWRRCQGLSAEGSFTVGGLTPVRHELFSGQPIWQGEGGRCRAHPGGFQRSVDPETGALIWTHAQYESQGETAPFW